WGLHTQGWAWTAGFASFLVCFYFTARETARQQAPAARQQESAAHRHTHGIDVKWSSRILWITLAARASILLLGTENLICQDITVSPFLWVSQLSLYLLSFILCFESDRWFRREVFYPLFAVTVAFAIVVSLPNANPSY